MLFCHFVLFILAFDLAKGPVVNNLRKGSMVEEGMKVISIKLISL